MFVPFALFTENPRFTLAFAALCAVASAYGFVHCARQLAAYADAPAATTVAAELRRADDKGRWVTLTDATLACRSGIVNGSGQFAVPVFEAPSQVVVTLAQGVACRAGSPHALTGVLGRMNQRYARNLSERGLSVDERALNLCTTCGPANDRIGVGVCALLFGLSLAFPSCVRALRKRGY